MADLKELYEKFRYSGNNLKALGEAVTSPIELAKGAFDTVKAGAGMVGSSLANLAEAHNMFASQGYHVPGSNPINVDPSLSPMDKLMADAKARLGRVNSFQTMGISDAFSNNLERTGTYDGAVIDTLRDLSPLNEIKAVITGESIKNPGTMLEPREYGEVVTTGIGKFLPMMKGLNKVSSTLRKGVQFNEMPRTVLTSRERLELGKGEMPQTAAAVESLDTRVKNLRSQIDHAAQIGHDPNALGMWKELQDTLDKRSLVTRMDPMMFKNMYIDIANKQPDVLNKHLTDTLMESVANGKAPKRIAETMSNLIENPVVFETVRDSMVKYGLPAESIADLMKVLPEQIRSGATAAGGELKIYSDLAKDVNYRLDKILADKPELGPMVAELRKNNNLGGGPIPWWQMVTNRFNAMSDIVRGAMVSKPVTAVRNQTISSAQMVTKLFEDTMIGTWQYAGGKAMKALGKMTDEQIPTFQEAMWKPINDLVTLQESVMGGRRSAKQWFADMQAGKFHPDNNILGPIEKVMKQFEATYPQELHKLIGAPVNDINVGYLFGDGLAGVGKKLKTGYANVESMGDGARLAITVLNTFNTAQEMFNRKYYFTNYLRENIRRFGFKSTDDFFAAMSESKTPMKKWFGNEIKLEDITSLEQSGQLQPKLYEAVTQYRLDNATAQLGKTPHSTTAKAINAAGDTAIQKATKEIATIKERLQAGETWDQIGPTVSGPVQRMFNGRVENASMALTDAVDKSLQHTFAYTPLEGHFGYQVMKTFETMPFLYAVLTPFPRFMLNATNWIFEHDPSQLKTMFKPGFMKELIESAKDPTKLSDPNLARRFGQAHTGAMLFGAARFIHDSGMAGPKYYQMNLGKDEDGNDQLVDMRPYNPFNQFLFIEHVMRAAANGKEPNLTAAELTEALLGLRRLNEVGVFALPDIIRQIDSSNPGAFLNSLKPIAGQYMAGAFTPFSIPLDIGAAAGIDKLGEQKDLSGNELVGPTINQFPVLRDILPARPDPFTGKAGEVQHPGIRLLGPNVRNTTVLEQEISTTGMPLNDLMGNFADPEADRLVRQKIGDVLGQRAANGQTMANLLGEQIAKATAGQPIELKKDMLRMLFVELRKTASQSAMAENPMAFMEYIIRQQPETARPILRNQLQPLKEQYNRERRPTQP